MTGLKTVAATCVLSAALVSGAMAEDVDIQLAKEMALLSPSGATGATFAALPSAAGGYHSGRGEGM